MEFRQIEEYQGYYEISHIGIIKGIERTIALKNEKNRLIPSRILSTRVNNCGYLSVRLTKDGITKTHFVHRLLAKAFIPNPDNLPQVNHISGDKLDNNIENLEWVSVSENVTHAYKNGLNNNIGGNNSMSKKVIDLTTGKEYLCIRELCKAYNVNYNTGRNALNGYTHTDLININHFKKVA